jgi:hypothetical protein
MLDTIVVVVVVIVCLVALIFLYAATRPKTFRIERSAMMLASRDTIFPYIDDLQLWDQWSPWAKIDPAMQKTYVGPASGEGAVFEWDGNNKAGAGRMEIVKSKSPKQVVINLRFTRPFASENIVTLALEAKGSATQITWTMDGNAPLMFRVMGLFMNMDAMLGKDFEKGLASLKAIVEADKK